MIYRAGYTLGWPPSEIRSASLAELLVAIGLDADKRGKLKAPDPMTQAEFKRLRRKHFGK